MEFTETFVDEGCYSKNPNPNPNLNPNLNLNLNPNPNPNPNPSALWVAKGTGRELT